MPLGDECRALRDEDLFDQQGDDQLIAECEEDPPSFSGSKARIGSIVRLPRGKLCHWRQREWATQAGGLRWSEASY